MLAVEEGERVVGTMQMAGTEMMRISNMKNMEVSVEISENDILKVKKEIPQVSKLMLILIKDLQVMWLKLQILLQISANQH